MLLHTQSNSLGGKGCHPDLIDEESEVQRLHILLKVLQLESSWNLNPGLSACSFHYLTLLLRAEMWASEGAGRLQA